MAFSQLCLILINFSVQCSPIPTLIEIYRTKSVNANLNPFLFIAMLMNGIIQMSYGILSQDSTIITTQFIGITLAVIYLVIFYMYCSRNNQKQILYYLLIIIISIFGGIKFIIQYENDIVIQAFGFLCVFSAIMLLLAPLSVAKAIIRDKNSIYLPKPIVAAGSLANVSWLLYGVILQDIFIWFPSVIGILSSMVQIGLLLKYPSIRTYQRLSGYIEETNIL